MKTRIEMKHLRSLVAAIAMMIAMSGFAQSVECEGKFGKDSITEVKNISMFNQYIQQKDYAAAFPYWKYLIENIPCYSKYITFYGPTIVKFKMKELKAENDASYEARKDGLIDTILWSYDMRIKYFGSEGLVLGKKANDMAKLRPNERQKAIRVFEQSILLEGKKTDDLVPMYYMDALIDELKKEAYSLDSLYIVYFEMQEIISHNLQANPKNYNDWVRTDTTLNKMMKPYLTCEKITEYFKPITDSIPTQELLNKVSKLLNNAKCTESDYFGEIAIALYKFNPTPEAALDIAKSYHGKQQYNKAKEYYLKSVDGMTDPIKKGDVYFAIANIEYNDGDCSGARKYAESALASNPSHGNAHLIIAYCIAKSSGSCTADMIDGRSVFWAAVDRAVKAKTVDPSVTDKANEMISAYASNFVAKEDAFFKGFTVAEGGSYTVPCLGISTTVRYK